MWGVAVTSSPAIAGCTWVTETVERAGVLVTQVIRKCTVSQEGDEPPGDPDPPPPASQTGAALGACLGVPESCVGDPEAAGVAALLIQREFRRIPLPPSGLVIQPPGGKTLVNLDTIFSTEAESFQRTVRLMGHEVRLKIWASSFSWHFGDGSEPLSTADAGRRYQRGLPMDSYITHQYKDAHVTVHPRVNTTYSAEYSVDGGPFQPVVGTVTIDGAPVSLRVVEARPVLTGTR